MHRDALLFDSRSYSGGRNLVRAQAYVCTRLVYSGASVGKKRLALILEALDI